MNFHRKNGPSIFMVICDSQILAFCREIFGREKKPATTDARIVQQSTDAFDFIFMSSCNSTIISNDFGILHALLNGGVTVVHKPELKDDPQFYTPWIISEKMDNWYGIRSNVSSPQQEMKI